MVLTRNPPRFRVFFARADRPRRARRRSLQTEQAIEIRRGDRGELLQRQPFELGDARGEQLLVELLRHPDARARRAAVSALAKHNTPSALESLSHALEDESPIVRSRAVAVLSTRTGPGPVQLLAPLLDREPDKEVLYATIAALGSIGGPALRPNDVRQRSAFGRNSG